MTELDASAVAKLLTEFGQRTALRGGNPYRARAYARAAENLLALSQPLQDIIAQDRLREIPGIGQAIADIVAKLHRTGTHPALEAMRKEGIESDILPDGSLDSGRGTRSFRFRRRQRAQPISAGTRGANATHHSRRLRSPYDHPRSHDRTAAAATARLRGRYRAGSQGLLRARRRGGDQCQPVAARSRLALAPKGAGTGLPDEHQPRRAFDVGAGPDPLGGRNGTQGLGAEN